MLQKYKIIKHLFIFCVCVFEVFNNAWHAVEKYRTFKR
jgi:hypothetical protein